ncbi:MAG TPA: amidohydrolase [Bryobacteraceae bacterium]|nr:amidohydrolase [Bryobacteraceae bacterium]
MAAKLNILIVSRFQRVCLLATLAAGFLGAQPADLVLRNGTILTLEASGTVQALAARDGKIVALGTNRDVESLTGPSTRIIDLNGRLAIPGLIEGHGHFMALGASKMELNLRNARNWDEIVAMVAAAARQAKPGTWILGSGFHQAKWDKPTSPNVLGFPVHDELSKVSPNNPVWLVHASEHAGFANAEAMRLAGIDKNTPDPPGGQILKDADGRPTGLLNEKAEALVTQALASYRAKLPAAERAAEARKQVELAEREALSKGITTFEDAGSPMATIDLLKDLAEHGKLDIRVWMMLRQPNDEIQRHLKKYFFIGAGDRHLTVRAIKRQIDGALGSRGALLLEPYSDLAADAPNRSGLYTEDPLDIRKTAELAITNGFQMCVHAIGDRANREVLDLYESVFKEHPEKNGKTLRWRIEHAQHLNSADIPRFAQLGVIAAMQAVHCTSDAPFVPIRLGYQRAEGGAYVWQKLMQSGAVVGNGTDTPVEDVDPIAGFYASVSRKLKDGSVFFPDQRMSRLEALQSYTMNNAYAAFEDEIKGSLKLGKLADITVLSKDILTTPEDEIPSAKVDYTIVGGKVKYQR